MFRVRASLLAAAFIILLQISTFAASPYVWRSVAINGGGFVSGIVFHPKQKDLAYARTDVGGAYRWSASTQSWIALNDDLGSDDSQLLGVLSIALDPSNPDLVYLACGQYLAGWAHHGAILRSTDRGSTWSRSDLSINLGGNSDGRSAGERLQVDPNSSNILYLGSSQDGLWKSADAGATWAKVSSFPGSAVVFIAIDPLSKDSSNISRTIYASADSSSGSLYRSTDAGSTWALVPGAPSGLKGYRGVIDKNGALLCVFNDGLGPNGVNTGALWKFQPGTSAWTNLSVPTGQGGFGGVSVDPNNPSLIVVSTLDRWNGGDQIYRTTDGGATWKAILNKANIDSSSAPWSASSSPHWIGDVQADPFNPANIFFVTGYGIFATANATNADTSATVTWTFCNKGLEETVPLGIISPPTGTAALISVVGDVDGFRHENLDISPPTRLTPTIGTTNDIAYAGSAPDSLVRVGTTVGQYSTDTGKNWTAFPATPPLASGSGAVTISADGSRFLWMPSKSGVYLSTNQGRTWTASTGSPSSTTDSFTPVADRVNAQKFYILQTVTGVLYRSTDGGSSFSTAAAGLPKGTAELAALPDKEGDLWAATNSGGLYHSTDSGTSFSQIPGIQEAYRVGFGKAAPRVHLPCDLHLRQDRKQEGALSLR